MVEDASTPFTVRLHGFHMMSFFFIHACFLEHVSANDLARNIHL